MSNNFARRAIKVTFDSALRRFIQKGSITVEYPDGDRIECGDHTKGTASPVVIFRDWADFRTIAVNPSLGFGLGYAAGRIDFPSEGDMLDFFRTITANRRRTPTARAAVNLRARRPNFQRGQQKHNIAAHYDGEQEQWWYENILGPTWLYTCARFTNGSESLDDAQDAKVLDIAAKLGLENEHSKPMHLRTRVLEIGCGWGYMASLLAQRYGVIVTGITIAEDQLPTAIDTAKEMGVDNLVEFRLVNFQDLPRWMAEQRLERFDAAYSVGMFEHVPHAEYADYYRVLGEAVKPGGRMLVHCIANQFGGAPDPLIARVIFPGSRLGSLDQMTKAAAKSGLVVRDVENLYQHYVLTLRYWIDNHVRLRAGVIDRLGEEFYRLRYYWLVASLVGFEVGDLNLYQTLYTNGKSTMVWSRVHLYT